MISGPPRKLVGCPDAYLGGTFISPWLTPIFSLPSKRCGPVTQAPGFLRGRVRPVHYSNSPGQAPNILLLHFYELYYLFFHYGFEVQKLYKTRIRFAPVLFTILFYPLMWLFSLEAVIRAEKDPVQRGYNRQILRCLFSLPLLLSDNIVVKARKTRRG